MHKLETFDCENCSRMHVCCSGLDLFDLPILKQDLFNFGKRNVRKVATGLWVVKPDGSDCPHYSEGSCQLNKKSDKRPLFCRAYPFIGNGTVIGLDCFCPKASEVLAQVMYRNDEAKHFVEDAARILNLNGKRMSRATNKTLIAWRMPVTVQFPYIKVFDLEEPE